jgi:hypothetical protein
LRHKIKGLSLYQADSGKALESTIERKQMSTKTTLKRIALVAVSALGLGVLSTVVPANATLRVPTAISFDGTSGLRAGETKSITVSFTLPSGTVNGDTFAVVARVTSAPAASFAVGRAATADSSGNNSTSAAAGYLYWKKMGSGNGSYGTMTENANVYNAVGSSSTNNWTAANVYTIDSSAGDSLTTGRLTLNLGPDAAGSYTILVGVGTEASSFAYDTAAELRSATTANLVANLTTASTTVTTGSTPDTVTIAAVTTGAPEDGTIGALWKATATTGTAATNLSSSETFVLSSTSSTVTFADHTGTALTNNTLTSSNFSAGVAYFTVQNTAAETATITITGAGLLSSSVTATGTVTFVTANNGDSAFSIASTTTSLAVNSVATVTNGTYYGRPGATSYPIRVTGTATKIETVTVTDTFGKFTGKAGAKYQKTLTLGATATPYASFTLTPLASLTANDSFIVELLSSTAGVRKVTVTATASTPTTMTVANSTRRSAALGANTFTATLKDQYGAVMANEVVSVSVTGRNATTTASSYTTNSLGQVSHTVTDAGTASVNDTVTFTSSTGSKSASGTIIYGTATAGTVLVEGPNVDDTLITYADKTDIAAGAGGATGSLAAVTATVSDAGANPLNGMLVTFTVAGTDCAILSTTQSVYTNAAGEASASVYKWTNGSCVVTATSGGKTGSDTVYFAQKTDTEARTIAGSVSGNVITATVKDRFGNPINGAYVWASRTGGGFFANGASSTSATTGEDGTVQFVYTTDPVTAATVKLALGSSTGADAEFGQSAAGANLVSTTTATDIFTATTVGTATTAETGVGASIAPAGVNSVTVTVAAAASATQVAAEAATDAAAEAIDAANAATDAANLAAEAADAATVAAEEARDAADAATAAVEELATQVATLMAALKAQITTLANTVAKIAKKVKA